MDNPPICVGVSDWRSTIGRLLTTVVDRKPIWALLNAEIWSDEKFAATFAGRPAICPIDSSETLMAWSVVVGTPASWVDLRLRT